MDNFSCLNASSDLLTNEYWTIPDEVDIVDGYLTASLLLVFIVMGLPWNGLVLVTIIKEKLYQQPSIIFLLNLVVTDIAFLVLLLPFLIVTGFAGEFVFGSSDLTRCQICPVGFLSLSLLYNSLFTIGMMSLDRFFYIYKPMQYDRIISKRWIILPILVAWIFSIAIGVTSRLLEYRDASFLPVFLACVTNVDPSYAVVIVLIGCAVLVVILITNILIIRIVLKNVRLIYAKRRSTIGSTQEDIEWQEIRARINKTRHAKQLHLFRVFAALMLSYALTWLPYILVLVALLVVRNYDTVPHSVTSLSFILFYSQGVVHPVLQTIFIADVRRPLMKYICLKKLGPEVGVDHEKFCCKNCFLWTAINDAVLPQQESNG